MNRYDIVIVGAGIAGASLGARLAAHRRVLIVEAEEHGAFHATGRSAAFWLASYGGAAIIPLSRASHADLQGGWPTGERSWLHPRGALHCVGPDGKGRDSLGVVSKADPKSKPLERSALEAAVPRIRPGWDWALSEPSCADIDVAGFHQACLAQFRRAGGEIAYSAPLRSAFRREGIWRIDAQRLQIEATVIVNAAGAWVDHIASRCGVAPVGIQPKRRTMVQLRVDQSNMRSLPLIIDAAGRFYFKGEGDNRIWLSPHDEIDDVPRDVAPEEYDVALAIERLQSIVDWKIEAVERRWAGLRSFTPGRVPAIGFAPDSDGFFWCAGQGGFGIQTAPAVSALATAQLLNAHPDSTFCAIDLAPYRPQPLP